MISYLYEPVFQGTFNPYAGLNSSDQCTPCTEGQYCETEGLNATTGPCEAGYYCPSGQNSSRPSDYPCTVGHYCPINSSQPIPCANGTYMNHTMGAQCYDCPDGWWVTTHVLMLPRIRTFKLIVPVMISQYLSVPFWIWNCLLSTCYCTETCCFAWLYPVSKCNTIIIICFYRYCVGGNLVTLCPEGHYCPLGTGFDWKQCPVGKYNINQSFLVL